MLSAGKPAQHTAEMEADLEKAEGMIRFLFNDVQLLKDGRHLQAEQMYRRSDHLILLALVYLLVGKVVNVKVLNTELTRPLRLFDLIEPTDWYNLSFVN